jgi:galactose-1-phosphate uridylyltransferase
LFVGRKDFHDLLKDAEISRLHAFAKGSFSNLRTQVRCFFSFCVYFDRTPLPADSNTIYGFVQFISRSMVPSTVRNYLSGVKSLHMFHGLPYPHCEDFLLRLELRGISRLNPHVPVRAIPVTPSVLRFFRQHMDHTASIHCAVWACALTLFRTMARLGSILPDNRASLCSTF